MPRLGSFLEILRNLFYYKSSPNVWWLHRHLWIPWLLSQTGLSTFEQLLDKLGLLLNKLGLLLEKLRRFFGQLLYKLELLFILTSGHTEHFLFSRLLSNLSILVVISHLLARVLKREKYNRETRMIKRISNDWAFLFFFKYLIFIHIKVSCKSLIYNSFYQLTELLCGV